MKPAERREVVRYAREAYAVSLRRACGLMEMKTSSFYYRSRPRDDERLRSALKQAAAKRRRWGYHHFLESNQCVPGLSVSPLFPLIISEESMRDL